MEFSDVLHDPQVIFPFHTWRGSYDGGMTQGQCAYYTTNGTQLAPAPDSTPTEGDTQYRVHANSGYGSTAEHCVTVDWPAIFTLSARQLRRGYAGPESWMGSLLFESRDASGLYYRRNRYYDSEKGRFTQEDPIGIAGGINVYGFAGGDPLTYSDPYGLKIVCETKEACDLYNQLHEKVNEGLRSDDERVRTGAKTLRDIMNEAARDPNVVYEIRIHDYPNGWGGGREVASPSGFLIRIDNRPPQRVKTIQRWVLLAHELGGAVGESHGQSHWRGALRGENAARRIAGCTLRYFEGSRVLLPDCM